MALLDLPLQRHSVEFEQAELEADVSFYLTVCADGSHS